MFGYRWYNNRIHLGVGAIRLVAIGSSMMVAK